MKKGEYIPLLKTNIMDKDFKKYANSQGISSTLLDDYGKNLDNLTVKGAMTPYILEERKLRVTQMDIFSRLMKDRIVWAAGPVNDRMSTIIQAQLMFLDSVDNTRDITLHLDTPGGSVKSGLSIVDVMDYIKADVQTVNTGMCASMGSILLGAGTKGKRSTLRFSKVMIHQVSHGWQGNIQDTRVSHMEGEKYNYILFKLLSKYTGNDFDKILKEAKNDRWFTSVEAKEFGIVDEIIEPKDGSGKMENLLEGFDEYYKNQNNIK